MSSQEHKKQIWNLIKKVKVGMLTTYVGGKMHARPMHLVQDDYDNRLWFFTDLTADKVQETLADHDVCVTFACPKDDVYVSLSGKANLCADKKLIDKFWNSFVSAWFPEGKDSDKVGLIEVKVDAGEHWETKSGKILQLVEIAKSNITHEKPDMGENEKFGSIG